MIKTALMKLKNNKRRFTKHQYQTIRGQILSGDVTGAEKGMQKILERGERPCPRSE